LFFRYILNKRFIIFLCSVSFSYTSFAGNLTPPFPKKKPIAVLVVNKKIHNIKTVKNKIIKPLRRHIVKIKRFSKVTNTIRLSEADAATYSRVFALQDIGNIKKADRELEKLENNMLMGNVLYQRYMGKHYKSSYKELKSWLKKYGDHAGAKKLYRLALKKRPKKGGGRLARARTHITTIGYHYDDIGKLANPYMSSRKHSRKERAVMAKISHNLSRRPTVALKNLEDSRSVFHDVKKYDYLRAQIAESFFYNGRVDKAYALATVSANRSGKDVPLAGWIAGLSAWKYKKYSDAEKYFKIAAKSKRASAWRISASAYWTARSYLRDHKPDKVGYWLRQAAKHPRSFYGIISAKALGMENSKFNWAIPKLNNKMVKLISSKPAGKRALALMDSRNSVLAEKELRQISPGKNKSMQEAMMALAHRIDAPAFEMRLGSGLKNKNGGLYDAALYPDAPWQPEGGYYIERALINAFIRQESKFNPNVRNRSSGATGLMQLMTRTARNVARHSRVRFTREKLKKPAFNIRLGQKYLEGLLKDKKVKNNLFKLAVAYNAGPGNLAKWERRLDYEDDALLFVESIPVNETRTFVERVLTNYWIYCLKYNQGMDSLNSVASGDWPIYLGEGLKG